MSKIIQIIPATGWWAVYLNENQTLIEGRLSAWALVEEKTETYTHVVGLDSDPECTEVTDADNFVCYRHESEPSLDDSSWESVRTSYIERQRRIQEIRKKTAQKRVASGLSEESR